MAFLSKILSILAAPVLDWLYSKAQYLFLLWTEKRKKKEEIEAANRAVREKVELAVTKEEKDEAARDLINRI